MSKTGATWRIPGQAHSGTHKIKASNGLKGQLKEEMKKEGKGGREDERGDNTAEHAKNIVPIQPM